MDDLDKIVGKLDILIKLTAVSAVAEQNFQNKVKILSSVGLQPKEIAKILGKTSNYIRVTLSSLRDKKERKKRVKK